MATNLGFYKGAGAEIQFIAEDADWSIRWDGEGIRRGLASKNSPSFDLVHNPHNIAHRVVHFGSQYRWESWAPYISNTNAYVVSFFHGKPSDGPEVERHIENFIRYEPKAKKIIVSNTLVQNRLVKWGISQSKIVKIPIGVDVHKYRSQFKHGSEDIRKKLGIGQDVTLIGSFQKDGNGWGEGLTPKLIKGPDIFLSVVEGLSAYRDIHVLLTGPARGYVIEGLKKLKIPFTHRYPSSADALARLYRALDLYLITSREEGGPKGLIESMSAGVPVVSTYVGMAPDLIKDGINGAITAVDDIEGLIEKSMETLSLSSEEKKRRNEQAYGQVLQCDWKTVAHEHLEKVYRPVMKHTEIL